MVVVCYFGLSKFYIFAADLVGRCNVHHCTNFIEISQTVTEISQLTFFKIVAIRNFGYFKTFKYLNKNNSYSLMCEYAPQCKISSKLAQ